MKVMYIPESLAKWKSGKNRLTILVLLAVVTASSGGSAQQTGSNGNGTHKPQQIKAVFVVAYPQGFSPRTEEISDRKIMLIVEPRGPSGQQLDLSFDRLGPNGQSIGNLKNGKANGNGNKHNWVGVIDVDPGQYRLTDNANPTHMFVLTVR